MNLNFESLHLFIEGMKYSKEAHAETKQSFEYGLNGRLYSHNGVLSYSSIKGTIEIYNNPNIVKYLGYYAFADELVLFVKYKKENLESNNTIIISEFISSPNLTIDIPFGTTEFILTNELTANANEDVNYSTQQGINQPLEPLENSYTLDDNTEEINLEDYYSLSGIDVPNYEACQIESSTVVPEYNKQYADVIIILKKENDNTLSNRIAWAGYLNWDINRKITTVGVYENMHYKRVYLTDNLNPFRSFNLKDDILSYRKAEEFDTQQPVNMLQPLIVEVLNSGSLKAMNVQYAYRLITENGQVTPFSPYSEMIAILNDNDGYDFAGGDVSEVTGKSVKLKCPVLSLLYNEIQCVAIEYEANTAPTAIRNLGVKNVSSIVYFDHYGTEAEFTEDLTIDDLIETTNNWTYCNDMTIKNNKIIAGGLRNEPYGLQEKYIQDMFLFRGWDNAGSSHNTLINEDPVNKNMIDPTNEEKSIYVKKRLFTDFLFFGSATLTLRNKQIQGSEKTISFTSSQDDYISYKTAIITWISALDLTDFPNLQLDFPDGNILFEPISDIGTDFSDYVFESNISQTIINFETEYGILTPTVNVSNLVWGAQSHGFNTGTGVRITWNEERDHVLTKSPELYTGGELLRLETPSLKKTFVKDEIYRLSINFFKKGNPLFSIVLGDVKTPAIGDEYRYIDENGEVVTAASYPGVPLTDFNYRNQRVIGDNLYTLRLEARVEVRIPCELKKYVDSYQIMYVERTENNRTILAQGISAPLNRIVSYQHPSEALDNYAESVANKWTLPFNGGPLYSLNGFVPYDSPYNGEDWNTIEDLDYEQRIRRRIITNRKMFYFDSPDLINGLVSDVNIKSSKVNVIGRLRTDHTKHLLRSRFPEDEIHERYFYPESNETNYKSASFSRKIGYKNIAGNENIKPYHINLSVFSDFALYNSEHEIEKSSKLLNKGEIIPSAVLGTSFEFSNQALSFFAQHAINSGLFLRGSFDDGRYESETHQSAQKSEGYPTLFIRTKDDLFTNDFIGSHITSPIFSAGHTKFGRDETDAFHIALNLDTSDPNFEDFEDREPRGVPSSDTHALINLKMNNETSIYGGRSLYAFSRNIFIPKSKLIPLKGATIDNQSQIFSMEGDFYTSLFIRTKNDLSELNELTYHNMHQYNNYFSGNDTSGTVGDYNRGGAWAYAVVLETEIESRMAHDYRFYRATGGFDFTLALNEFINSAYLKKNNLRVYSPVPYNFKDDPLLNNILSASKTKLNGDYYDAWTTFLLNEFYELEKAKGTITNVTSWKDEIFAVQERETSKVNIDENDFITTQAGERVAVKKGDGTTFVSHEKISDFGTSIRRALAEGEFGFSFFDEYNLAFVKFNEPLSLQKELHTKLRELFRNDRIIDTEGYYDTEYKETNIRIRTESNKYYTLSYNEVLGVFNGYLSYNNDIYIMFDKRVFAPIRDESEITVECPEIISDLTLNVLAGIPFYYQIEADGNPTVFNADNLPTGVSINTSTGLISGVIDSPGVFNIDISATSECTGTVLTLVVTASGGQAPVITNTCPNPFFAGNLFELQITATNNPLIFNVTGLPQRLNVTPEGFIYGTVPLSGTYPIVIYVENEFGNDTLNCTLTVTKDPEDPSEGEGSGLNFDGLYYHYALLPCDQTKPLTYVKSTIERAIDGTIYSISGSGYVGYDGALAFEDNEKSATAIIGGIGTCT